MHGFSTPCLFPFSLCLIQRNSRVERMIYKPSLHHYMAIAGAVPPLPPITTVELRLGFGSGTVVDQTVAGSPAMHIGERWVALKGPMHNLGRLCIHIHLYQWATGKCKPKVIALDKNICLVNKYSNEGSLQVPQTDTRLTGIRRERR